MPLLPKSKKARRRLMVVAIAAPLLIGSVALSLYAMGDAAVFFYSPSQAKQKQVPAGRTIRIGGLVQAGSVAHRPDGAIVFTVADHTASAPVLFKGDLPDLFREGQGVVAQGAFDANGVFEAKEVLAKHDEKYMPKEVADALKKSGEWRESKPAGAGAT
jgi:cytochrome c-type biogenesis protein CcmE